jgi:GNAT superfamily N-acetyltransferase
MISDGRLQLCSFQEVLPLWREKLWPRRQSEILEKSSLRFGGGYDGAIYKTAAPLFWGYFMRERLIAANSGFWTSKEEFRSRGLYVEPEFRGRGIAQMLLRELLQTAQENGARRAWSIPRQSALKTYQAVGFETHGDFFTEGMEFGPNIFVYKDL